MLNQQKLKGHISFKKDSNLSGLFYNFYNCESFNGLDNLDVSEVVNMSYMFYMWSKANKKLETLNISDWNIFKVEYINNMFYGCSNLKSIKLNDITIESYVGLN